MIKSKKAKKGKKRHDRPVLRAEEQTHLQMLVDRVLALDPEANSFTRFVESLKPLVQQSVAFTVALAEALASTANPVAVKVIQALQGMEAKKPVRRALKTALYRLARQGVVKEQEEAEVEPRVLVPRPEDRQAPPAPITMTSCSIVLYSAIRGSSSRPRSPWRRRARPGRSA